MLFILIRTDSFFRHKHCFKTLSIKFIRRLFRNRKIIAERGSLQKLRHRTKHLWNKFQPFVKFHKYTVNFNIKLSSSWTLLMICSDNCFLTQKLFRGDYQQWIVKTAVLRNNSFCEIKYTNCSVFKVDQIEFIILCYVFNQKQLFLLKIYHWKLGFYSIGNGNDRWSSFSFYFLVVCQIFELIQFSDIRTASKPCPSNS